MTQDNNERPENPFIAKYQARVFETTQLGLDFPHHLHWDRDAMQLVAYSRIHEAKITDEAGKIKVYEEVKAQFKEYEDYLRSQGVPDEPGVSKPASTTTESKASESRSSGTVITVEYPQLKELTAVLRDMLAFTERLFENNEQLTEAAKQFDERLRKLEDSTVCIASHQNAYDQLDERLRKLERYTQG